jgi:hypothetical protein
VVRILVSRSGANVILAPISHVLARRTLYKRSPGRWSSCKRLEQYGGAFNDSMAIAILTPSRTLGSVLCLSEKSGVLTLSRTHALKRASLGDIANLI